MHFNDPNNPSTGPNPGVDRAASARDAENLVTAKQGAVYIGIVSAVDTYHRRVTVNYQGKDYKECIYMAETLASLIGFYQTGLPPVGSYVLFTPGNPSIVIGAVPSVASDQNLNVMSVSGDLEEPVIKQKGLFTETEEERSAPVGAWNPQDVYPGEMQWSNNMGVMLRLLGNIAQLNAADAAKVEVCLLNAMVRIISNYYVHHSVAGDEMIYNNGRCNKEEHFTSYPFEAEGQESESSKIVEMDGVVAKVSAIKDPVGETGRWRISTFTGFVGDLIHTMVTDPTKMISTYMEGAKRAGKSRFWQGGDGTILMQSAAEIAFEVVPSVIIPTQLKNWNDPDLKIEDAMKNLNKEWLKLWGTGPKFDDLKTACWQLRNYARWLSEVHALARFHQLSEGQLKMYEVPSEEEAEKATWAGEEKDKKEANPAGTTPEESVYATIRIMRDGSVMIMDNMGSSIVMNQGNINIDAAKDLRINAGGSIAMVCKNFFVKAANNIEIVSIGGAMILKARAFINMLCELGRIWIKSDASIDHEANKKKAQENKVWDNITEYVEPEMKDFAIVLDATSGRILANGAEGIVANSTREEGDIKIQAFGKKATVALATPTGLGFFCHYLSGRATKSVGISTPCMALDAPQIKMAGGVAIRGGQVELDTLRSRTMTATVGIYGPPNEVYGHENHINTIPERLLEHYEPDMNISGADEAQEMSSSLNAKKLTYDLKDEKTSKWGFLSKPEMYGTKAESVLESTSLKCPMYIDTWGQGGGIAKAATASWFYGEKDGLITGIRNDTTTLPYPGKGAVHYIFTGGLKCLSEKESAKPSSSWIVKHSDMHMGSLNHVLYIGEPKE